MQSVQETSKRQIPINMVRWYNKQYKGSQKQSSVNCLQLFQSEHKRSKYGNHRCMYKGMNFDSDGERDRYIYLESCQRKGLITGLQRQVEFQLIPDEYEEYVEHLKTKDKLMKRRVFTGVKYYADFVYMKDGKQVVSDYKGTADSKQMREGAVDDVFFVKYKMMHSILGIDIYIVDSPTAEI